MDTQNNKELEEVRQQMASLNDKLDKDIVVDETSVRGLIKSKMAKDKKHINVLLVVFSLYIVFFAVLYASKRFDISIEWTVFMTLIFIFSLIKMIYELRKMKRKDLGNAELLTVQKEIIKQKKALWWRVVIAIIIVAIWFGLIIRDTIGEHTSFVLGLITGGVIGLIGGFVKIRKEIKTYNNILAQIREYSKE